MRLKGLSCRPLKRPLLGLPRIAMLKILRPLKPGIFIEGDSIVKRLIVLNPVQVCVQLLL